MLVKRLQLAMIHVAVAMTLVPINSTLNRVMIKELGLAATLVAVLASLPYIFSPIQVYIGSYSDRHPLLGWRRTPYILAGLLLCVAGVITAPLAVFELPESPALGLLLSAVAFGAWGMGFNLASVTYLALAAELSPPGGRQRTVSLMWFFMIGGIIITAAALSRLLDPFSFAALERAFTIVALAALGLGLLGLFRLEPRGGVRQAAQTGPVRQGWREQIALVMANPPARRFFFYLILMLAAILGQDVLLEPYAAEAFGLPVQATTRITSIWGGCLLLALLAAGPLERWLSTRNIARAGSLGAIAGFLVIAASGLAASQGAFYGGVVLLGLATGLATVSNLALMFEMTTARVGLFIGAWGMADALARLVGTMLSGVLRDTIAQLSGHDVWAYAAVFLVEALMLLASLYLLRRIDPRRFQQNAASLSTGERAAMLGES